MAIKITTDMTPRKIMLTREEVGAKGVFYRWPTSPLVGKYSVGMGGMWFPKFRWAWVGYMGVPKSGECLSGLVWGG